MRTHSTTKLSMRNFLIAFACATAFAQSNPPTFTNPLLPSGPDPWVTYRDGYYYYMHTTGVNLTLWKTRNIADLSTTAGKVVWTPPADGPYSRDIWAPEIHFLQGRWYIYFSADGGVNQTHRVWVIENSSPDPTAGEWIMKGKIADADDRWGIDGTVFENQGHLYFLCSGWEGDFNGVQSIYIMELDNPYTAKSKRVRLSVPSYPWEKIGDRESGSIGEDNPGLHPDDPLHIDVNEGPEMLQHNGKLFLIYSASACWSDHYTLGMMTTTADRDLMNAASWSKSTIPVFWESPSAGAYATGHNGFFQSPDGTEDWIIYHANSQPHQGCSGQRNPRAQRFYWKADGTPDFGRPAPIGQPLARPSEAAFQ